MFNIEYNTSSHNKNYNIANKSWQKPKWYVYCFDCKMTFSSFTFNNDTVFPVSTLAKFLEQIWHSHCYSTIFWFCSLKSGGKSLKVVSATFCSFVLYV